MDLSGQWQFSIDPTDIGIGQQWYARDLPDSITLPGTTDQCQKGFLNQDTTTLHLNRLYHYEGPAWYRKKISIPQDFRDEHIELIMERTKPAKIWIDDHYAGDSRLLQSPQIYDLSPFLTPGEHALTIRINNDLKLTPYGNVHIYSDETQTNWNGIIGDFFLQAAPRTYIAEVQVFPDIDERKIAIRMAVVNGLGCADIDVDLQVIRFFNAKKKELGISHQTMPCDPIIHLEYALGDDMALWDDYQQPLYQLVATIRNGEVQDSRTVPFGMRTFAAAGTQFTINGRTTFLRGKHDACVFPLTGNPPMDVEGWLRVFKIARSYGINHYRFHSYCPPEAAFAAADQLGLFLQPELPFWGGLESDSVAAMLQEEGLAMLKSYANHPSFVMFCPGNEIWSGYDRVERIIIALKKADGRLLYTMGANNSIGYVGPRACSDFHIAARTPFAHDTTLTHTRFTHAFVDSRDGGILNTQPPSTMTHFAHAVAQVDVPLLSHEMGQYQIYPDYDEIEKYTGVLRAWNLVVFHRRLEKAGLLEQNDDFQRASGAWAALCYKAEMEAALRTPGLAGFQLLDLQDFPGQGTALVGILDAFMESKKVVSREEWLQSCNDVVVLLRMRKFCWRTDEDFQAYVQVANYSDRTVNDDMVWAIVNARGECVVSGALVDVEMKKGGLTTIGDINARLDSLSRPEKLTVRLALRKSGHTNAYPLWLFPAPGGEIEHEEIAIVEELDDETLEKLANGQKVLLFPTVQAVQEKSVAGLFPPDFWNYGMFKGISERANKPVSPGSLGILTDPDHPLFDGFPTDSHTNWHWWSIIKASRPLILDKTAHHYRPIVQVIDNIERNSKLGLIFEFAVGDGKLLVCMARLRDILDEPEAYHLLKSMINYMKSDAFAPDYAVDRELLHSLL